MFPPHWVGTTVRWDIEASDAGATVNFCHPGSTDDERIKQILESQKNLTVPPTGRVADVQCPQNAVRRPAGGRAALSQRGSVSRFHPNRDSYAFRDDRANYWVPWLALCAQPVWRTADARSETRPPSSGSTLERSEELDEAPREERE